MQIKNLKKILITMENFEYGGTMTQLISLINNSQFKDSFFYIITNKENKATKQFFYTCKNRNVKIIYFNSLNAIFINNYILKYLYLLLRPFFFFISILQMIKIIKEIEFDLIIADCGGFGNFRSEIASLIAAKLLGKKNLFLIIHHCYTKPIFWKILIESINLILGTFLSGIIFVSKATMNSIEKNSNLLFFSGKKTKVIHNGIDIKPFNKKRLKAFSKFKNIYSLGMLARIEDYKGQIDLLRGFNNLSEKEKNSFHIFFIGNGSKKEIRKLNEFIKNYKLKKFITRFKYINEDSFKIVSNFDIFFSLTKDFEGFGYSIAEALYCSVPVFSTKVGGVVEYLNHNNSTLINPGDINSITLYLKHFLINRKDVEKKIFAGKQTIIKKFNSDIMAKNYKNYFYKQSV